MTDNKWITPFGDMTPIIGAHVFVDVSARVIGDVQLAEAVSIWPMAVLRADAAHIRIGSRSAVLDLALVEAPTGRPVVIGEKAIVSHGAMVHGATVESGALIGIGAIVLDGAHIGSGSLIGANALVTGGTRVPPNSLVLGSPAKVIRATTPEERALIASQLEDLYKKSRQMMQQA